MSLLAEKVEQCNLCGSRKIKNAFCWEEFFIRPLGIEQTTLSVFVCEDCGLIFLNPQPTAEVLDYHYSSSSSNKELIEGSRARYRELQAEFISSKVDKRGNAFDVGCFDGTFLHFLKEDGWSVSGCDYNEKALGVAKSKYGIEAQKGGIDDVDVKDNSQNLLSFVHVLEHMPDPNRAFEWSRSKLAGDGYLYIMVPDATRMFSSSIYGFFSFPHLYYYTLGALKNYLEKYGFEIIDERACDDFEFVELLAVKREMKNKIEVQNNYDESVKLITEYAKKWQEGLDEFSRYFTENENRWIKKNLKVLLWGGGLHTHIATSLLPIKEDALNLIEVIDKDEALSGSEVCGFKIFSPGELGRLKPDVVLVSSYWYAEEIGRELVNEFGFNGEIFYFYGRPTKGHPIARDY